jgi:hypothetical protein
MEVRVSTAMPPGTVWAEGPTMRTRVSRISMPTPTHRKNTWMKSTQIWLKRLLCENTLESFPRNVEGSRRLKRTVRTTIWERRHGTSRASNARLDSIPELQPSIHMRVLVGGAGVPGTCSRYPVARQNPRWWLLTTSTCAKPYRNTGIAVGITLSLLWKR